MDIRSAIRQCIQLTTPCLLLGILATHLTSNATDPCGKAAHDASERINVGGINITGENDYSTPSVLQNLDISPEAVPAMASAHKSILGIGEGYNNFIPTLYSNDVANARAYDPAYGIKFDSNDPRLHAFERFKEKWPQLLFSNPADIPTDHFDLATSHMLVNNFFAKDRGLSKAQSNSAILQDLSDHFFLALKSVKPGTGEIRIFGFPKGSEETTRRALQLALKRLGHKEPTVGEISYKFSNVTQRGQTRVEDSTQNLGLFSFRRPNEPNSAFHDSEL